MTPAERYVQFFRQLTPASLAEIAQLFAADARFKDPFNDVRGIEAIRHVFEHMFAITELSRFDIIQYATHDNCLLILWHYEFKARDSKLAGIIPGTSVVYFNADGKVQEHVDYWDPAEHVYAKVPILKTLMAWLRRRISA